MGIQAHYLQDNNSEKFYPYAHADATFDRDGEKVGTILDELKQSVTEAQNVQPDWNETSNSSAAYIKNKPTEMPASDVPAWAKAETKPTYTASEVGADPTGSADAALSSAKAYIDENVETLNNAIGSKVDKVSGKGLSTNDYTTTEKNKLSGIASGAEVNQNAFSNIAIGSSTIAADSETDTLTLVAGSNITLTPDTTNDKVTISATNTTYPPAGSGLGLVKSGGDVTIADGTITVNDDSHNHTIANVDGLQAALDGKSDSDHTHTVDSSLSSSSTNPVQNKVINTALAGKVPTTRTVNGKTLSANISLSASDVGADTEGSADTALAEAKSYTDTKVSALVNGAPETLDTLSELASAMQDNDDAIATLETIAASKANASDLTSHTGNSTIHITSAERTKWNAAKTHADSAHAPSNAEVNQNAFSNITVGSTTIAADTKTDTLTLAGSNITLTPDTANDKVTIGITKANVTAALGYTPSESDTTYNIATTDTDGLMSSEDKTKLNGIATGANKYTHPAYTAKSSGLYKVTVDAQGHVSATSPVTKSDITALGIPGQDTNTTYTLGSFGITATAAEINKLDGLTATTAELNYVDGVTSNIQTQLNGKSPTTHSHSAATTSANGFMSSSDKSKLDGIASGANKYTHPSYTARSSGLYKVAVDSQGHVSSVSNVTKSDITNLGIPGQDTNTWTAFKGATTSTAGTAGYVPAPSAGSATRYFRSDGTWATPPNTTYSSATTSSAGLMSAADKTKLDGIATGANKYTLPTASSSTLGGVKTTSAVTSTAGLTPCPIISGVPYYKDTNTTYTLSSFGITATAAELNKLDGVTATATEINYIDGVTSNIQTQLNGKAPTSHNHSASNITSGTLPLSRGGTGGASATAARTSLGALNLVISSSEPTGQNTGDIWFKEID